MVSLQILIINLSSNARYYKRPFKANSTFFRNRMDLKRDSCLSLESLFKSYFAAGRSYLQQAGSDS